MPGKTHSLWQRLIAYVLERHPPITQQWNFSGVRFGWSLRLKQKDRILLYLTPCRGHFLTGIALGEKAVTAGRAEGIPEAVLSIIEGAPKYAEGFGIRMKVATASELRLAEHLVDIKTMPLRRSGRSSSKK